MQGLKLIFKCAVNKPMLFYCNISMHLFGLRKQIKCMSKTGVPHESAQNHHNHQHAH